MANTIHAVFRSDALLGTGATGAGLYSVRFYNEADEVAIDNGHVAKLEALLPGERELWKGVAPTADTALDEIVVLAGVEVMYDQRLSALTDFYNEAGTDIRGYKLHTGDIFSVTTPAVDADADIAVGDIIELQAGTKLKAVKSATGGSTKVGTVIAVETVGSLIYVVVRVG